MAFSSGARLLGRFFGNTVSGAASFGAGVALGPVLAPPVRLLRNTVNAAYPFEVPDAGVLAAGVAQGQVDPKRARSWAAMHGIGDKAFDALVSIANTGPGVAAAFELWRRHKTDEAGFRRAAKRQGLEPEWIDGLVELFYAVLDPADLARGIHRGLVPDPGLLKGELPSGEGHVPAYPVYDIDALAEALAAGFDKDHLGVLVGLQGNPMGAHEAAEALFRGILTRDDYLRAIAEGNTRNEWADAIKEQTRQIPTARDFLENALRGYRSLAEAIDGAELHGMTPEHATLIYQNQGRPMNIRQITQALARGAKFNPEPGELKDPYKASIVEGNVKPGYYELAESLKYTLPSPFAIRQLAQSGVWNEEKTKERLLWWGWLPADAADVAKAWAAAAGEEGRALTKAELLDEFEGGFISPSELRDFLTALGYSGPGLDLEIHLADARRIKSWRDKAVTALNKSYLGSTMERSIADTYLQEIGVTFADTRTRMLDIWDLERQYV